ncbi:GNAT family N-acetyltransferase [uncultured Alistipes sp.]|uniref:GNAT family N-acetyltransferase n=1 Tax=uncultured Alistipes sp. TaxID=538949 RepID=UPI002609A218|nr:GNAT family N-acetyltransferase [uncultured Alistipes sp.]
MIPSDSLQIRIAPFGELPTATYHRIVQAREEVFFLEQRITCPDADETDPRSLFQWIEQEGRVIAFLRIIPPGILCKEASVGRVLVIREYRRQGICRRMMREALRQIAARWPGCDVYISAQAYLEGFYASLGFETVTPPYEEAGIRHVGMLLRGNSAEQ